MKPSTASNVRLRDAEAADLPAIGAWLGRAPEAPARGESWRLASSADGTPRAALRLVPALGLELPRVSYHVGCVVHAARELGLFHRQRTLLLGHDHTGASELADIAWTHEGLSLAEQSQALHALVADALGIVQRQRERFAATLVVELPGPRDATGQSPFWQGLGRHFYRGDPLAARAAHGLAWCSHVAPLLPQQPLYTSFLPRTAEAAIGQVAERARVLREVLEDFGFRYGHHVNVEDGGPILELRVDDLRT